MAEQQEQTGEQAGEEQEQNLQCNNNQENIKDRNIYETCNDCLVVDTNTSDNNLPFKADELISTYNLAREWDKKSDRQDDEKQEKCSSLQSNSQEDNEESIICSDDYHCVYSVMNTCCNNIEFKLGEDRSRSNLVTESNSQKNGMQVQHQSGQKHEDGCHGNNREKENGDRTIYGIDNFAYLGAKTCCNLPVKLDEDISRSNLVAESSQKNGLQVQNQTGQKHKEGSHGNNHEEENGDRTVNGIDNYAYLGADTCCNLPVKLDEDILRHTLVLGSSKNDDIARLKYADVKLKPTVETVVEKEEITNKPLSSSLECSNKLNVIEDKQHIQKHILIPATGIKDNLKTCTNSKVGVSNINEPHENTPNSLLDSEVYSIEKEETEGMACRQMINQGGEEITRKNDHEKEMSVEGYDTYSKLNATLGLDEGRKRKFTSSVCLQNDKETKVKGLPNDNEGECSVSSDLSLEVDAIIEDLKFESEDEKQTLREKIRAMNGLFREELEAIRDQHRRLRAQKLIGEYKHSCGEEGEHKHSSEGGECNHSGEGGGNFSSPWFKFSPWKTCSDVASRVYSKIVEDIILIKDFESMLFSLQGQKTRADAMIDDLEHDIEDRTPPVDDERVMGCYGFEDSLSKKMKADGGLWYKDGDNEEKLMKYDHLPPPLSLDSLKSAVDGDTVIHEETLMTCEYLTPTLSIETLKSAASNGETTNHDDG